MSGHGTTKITAPAQPFDINALLPDEPESGGYPRLPALAGPGIVDVASYTDAFMNLGIGSFATAKAEPFIELAKVMGVAGVVDAPEMQTYARLTAMPNALTKGLIQWPDLPAATLKKIAQDHYVVHTIIQQRIGDILRYSSPSTHPWKPGWAIVMRDPLARPTETDVKDMADARRFVQTCNSVYGWDVRKRDASHLNPFQNFLAASVRDTYRYDGIAWWTDMDLQNRVRAFKALPAGSIMLTTRDGYLDRPDVFACGVDEAGSIKHEFTRRDLTWIIRNSRSDADSFGYGYPEIVMAVKLIQGFSNAFDMNADVFTKDATPHGILKLSGMWSQRQVEVMSRIWGNLKRGATKRWALPAIPLPKDGDLDLLDLSRLKDNDAYYQDYINMVAGLFCAIYAFPANRLGYRISGRHAPSEQKDGQSPMTLVDEIDTGLPVLLYTIQNALNEYILWTRWPHLMFVWRGANPKEDAREYEARRDAATYGEFRAMSDLPPLEDIVKDASHKELAQLMELAPINPNLAGIWQNMCSAWLGAESGGPEGKTRSKSDPAASEGHGHASGVRRDSKAESSE